MMPALAALPSRSGLALLPPRPTFAAVLQRPRAVVQTGRSPQQTGPAQEILQPSVLMTALQLGTTALGMALPGLAYAVIEDEDVINEATEAVLAASRQEQSAYDLFVSLVFGVVVLLLSVVTLGVGYLSLKQWLDSRQEKDDQEAELKARNAPAAAAAAVKRAKQEDEEVLLSLRKVSSSRSKAKGFGAKAESEEVATTPKEF